MNPDAPRHIRAWRDFKRMQGAACVFASLIYAAAALNAWSVLPGDGALKASLILVFPAVFLMAVLWAVLMIRALRRHVKRYVWMSFAAGFGQTWVLTGFAVLAFAAGLIYLQVHGVARGGRYPAGVFSGFGAGLGILFGQALLVFALEREPDVRAIIEG